MSNTTGFMGFKNIGFLPGASPDYQLQALQVSSANATAIYRGDPVVFSGGFIVAATSTANAVHGIMDGAQYVASGLNQWNPYCPASQTATVYILSAPNALFLAQTLVSSIVTAQINKNVGFAVGSGTTIGGGFSGYSVDGNTSATTSSLPFRVIGLASSILPAGANGTDNTSNNNQIIVSFNNQDFHAGVTGV